MNVKLYLVVEPPPGTFLRQSLFGWLDSKFFPIITHTRSSNLVLFLEGGLWWSRLLIKPVQRCLKYPLLLEQILQLTPPDHPDLAQLENAKMGMMAVADAINEVSLQTQSPIPPKSKFKDLKPNLVHSRPPCAPST